MGRCFGGSEIVASRFPVSIASPRKYSSAFLEPRRPKKIIAKQSMRGALVKIACQASIDKAFRATGLLFVALT
jgi:hypothetical protein